MKTSRNFCVCLSLILAGVMSSGCVTLRPRDDQRMQIAQEAAKLASELRQSETGPFSAMEANIATVATAVEDALGYLQENRRKAFVANFAELSREQLAEELMTQFKDHQLTRDVTRDLIADASKRAKEAIERQARIAGIPPPSDSKLETVIANVEKRLSSYDEIQSKIAGAMNVLKDLEVEGTAKLKAGETFVNDTVASVRKFVNAVETDPNVVASSRLLLQAGQQVAAAEMARLLEMQRHLHALKAIQEELDRHDELYLDNILRSALGVVAGNAQYASAFGPSQVAKVFTGDGAKTDFELDHYPVASYPAIEVKVDGEVPLFDIPTLVDDEDNLEALVRFDSPPAAGAKIEISYWHAVLPEDILLVKNDCFQREWGEAKSLAEFIALKFAVAAAAAGLTEEDVKHGKGTVTCRFETEAGTRKISCAKTAHKSREEEDPETGDLKKVPVCGKSFQQASGTDVGKFIGQVTFLLFIEAEFNQQQGILVATERQRNSIRVSQINAGERLDLVQQVATALQIYYQGGISPQEASSLVLMAANALATGFIGAQL